MVQQPPGSHQVLARKWRPRDFESLVGQDTVVRALRHALDNDRLHHAYLLTGTRGVGKTTIARILAKALNCEQGVSSRPCGRCSACVGVDQGRFPDYVEMDAASNRKVEEMTPVLENAAYSPSVGRFKVFVIDEVHMLSNHAFNAMLKTLEEPPGHVVFVLATTDPQKVPVTVLSRCMQFGLRNMSAPAVAGHLARVLQAEQVAFEAPALDLLGRAAAGSMRDALSLLDQAIALGGGSVSLAAVREMLGTVDQQVVAQLLGLLAAGNPARLVSLADEMAATNAPFGPVLTTLASALQRVALAQLDPSLVSDDPADGGDGAAVRQLAATITPEEVQVWYQVAIHGARDLPLAPDPQVGFTMSLLRMLAFRDAAARVMDGTPPDAKPRAPAPGPSRERRTSAAAPASPIGGDGAVRIEGEWSDLAARLPANGSARQFLQQSELIAVEDKVLRLRVPIRPLMEPGIVARVTDLLSNWFGTPVRLDVSLGETGDNTAAARAREEDRQRQSQAAEAINADPFVRELIEGFGATIVPDSIKPLQGDAG
jgi:DNA polymerase-3 subunit gamma/tau